MHRTSLYPCPVDGQFTPPDCTKWYVEYMYTLKDCRKRFGESNLLVLSIVIIICSTEYMFSCCLSTVIPLNFHFLVRLSVTCNVGSVITRHGSTHEPLTENKKVAKKLVPGINVQGSLFFDITC